MFCKENTDDFAFTDEIQMGTSFLYFQTQFSMKVLD